MEVKPAPSIARLGLSPQELKGKVVVVTGGGRGIGREIVRAFAWLGARLIIAEIADAGLETLAVELKRIAASGNPSSPFVDGLPRLRLLLGKLEVYYRQAPQEAGRFIKDTQALAELQKIAGQREGIIRDLLKALEGFSG